MGPGQNRVGLNSVLNSMFHSLTCIFKVPNLRKKFLGMGRCIDGLDCFYKAWGPELKSPVPP